MLRRSVWSGRQVDAQGVPVLQWLRSGGGGEEAVPDLVMLTTNDLGAEVGVIGGLLLAALGIIWRELRLVRSQLTECLEEKAKYRALAERFEERSEQFDRINKDLERRLDDIEALLRRQRSG